MYTEIKFYTHDPKMHGAIVQEFAIAVYLRGFLPIELKVIWLL